MTDIRKYIKEYTTQVVKEMTGTGTGAGFAPDVSNPQIATTRAFKKKVKKEDAPMLAGGKIKKNYAVDVFGFTNAPSVPNRKSKFIDYKELWEEALNEGYATFRKETKTRNKPEQFHQAVKSIKKKVAEINRLFEYMNRLKVELSEGEELKYRKYTENAILQIKEMVKQLHNQSKKLK